MGPFKLYPEERHWWSFSDYQAVLDEMARVRPARVLEFGPGSSTLALIEGGAHHIDTCEDNPDWAGVYEERLQAKYPDIVQLHRYEWKPGLSIPALKDARYDFALIDGPFGSLRRDAPLRFALKRAPVVMMADVVDAAVVSMVEAIARRAKFAIEYRTTGPLSGAFAVLTQQG